MLQKAFDESEMALSCHAPHIVACHCEKFGGCEKCDYGNLICDGGITRGRDDKNDVEFDASPGNPF